MIYRSQIENDNARLVNANLVNGTYTCKLFFFYFVL